MNYAALDTYLEPLQSIFQEEGVNELSINKPKEVWIVNRGEIKCEKLEEFDINHLKFLGRLNAQATGQKLSEEAPLLSATLRNAYRIQIVLPPACEPDKVVMSIRKPSSMQLPLDDYEKIGTLSETVTEATDNPVERHLELL